MKKIINHPAIILMIVLLLAVNVFFSVQLYTSTQVMQTHFSDQYEELHIFYRQMKSEKEQLNSQLDSIKKDLEASRKSFLDLKEEAHTLMEENEELKKKLL
ncbi:MAG: hypothetical protein D5S00_11745 [Tindallia sp. MSAO_Bac2]|nr:MAG: hypothetical protein D5S00_11745 [Tindallia sp. MSAO_Bac2]